MQSIYDQPASITFYECDSVTIDNSSFSSNIKGDDFINFFRSNNIHINNSTFSNIVSDAIDSDFLIFKLVIPNSIILVMMQLMVLEVILILTNNSFENILDKAISAGEKRYF